MTAVSTVSLLLFIGGGPYAIQGKSLANPPALPTLTSYDT